MRTFGIVAGVVLWLLLITVGYGQSETCDNEIGDVLAQAKIDGKMITEAYVYGKGLSYCLYAVRIGDTSKAEYLDMKFASRFGLFSINAKLYVRPADRKSESDWKEVIYRRPTEQEVDEFLKNPTKFYSERMVKTDDLPYVLYEYDMAKVDFELVYFDGGSKIYFLKDTTPIDVVMVMFDVAWRVLQK